MLSTTTYKLTPEQKRALAFIKKHGELIRYQGGLFSYKDVHMLKRSGYWLELSYPAEYVDTQTMEALERRGYVEVAETAQGWGREYAVKYKLKK